MKDERKKGRKAGRRCPYLVCVPAWSLLWVVDAPVGGGCTARVVMPYVYARDRVKALDFVGSHCVGYSTRKTDIRVRWY